jgi:transcription elongation factor Elf1
MDWLESKYIGLVSSRLVGFKKKSGNTFNFRCPICGDSKKSKTKARGWIFERSGKSRFYCHNCQASMTLPKFIQTLDEALYREYKMEVMRESGSRYEPPKVVHPVGFNFRPVFENTDPLKTLTRVSALDHRDPIKKYIMDRKIPTEFHYKLFVTDAFCKYINTLIPEKFSAAALKNDEPRLVIPFINRDSKVHALQGRSMDPRSMSKYITIMLDESVPKIFGLDTLQPGKAYVLEGPIDAMFLPNAIASAGGDLRMAQSVVPKEDMVVVYDNERRSPDTIKKMNKAIKNGYKVCFWPENILYKDVNDMVKYMNMSSSQVARVIDENTYSGLQAEMELSKWKRVNV